MNKEEAYQKQSGGFLTAYEAYEELINKLDKRMWKQNPLVWVYEFKLVD